MKTPAIGRETDHGTTEPSVSRFKAPSAISNLVEAQNKWLALLEQAESLVTTDSGIQNAAEKHNYRIIDRALPPEVIGRSYVQYCDLINRMYDAYLNNVQLQRAPYIIEIIALFLKRMYELRKELIRIIVNDYIYVDAALIQMKKTPFDIQIIVPYHIPLEARPDKVEGLLQQMWKDAIKRKTPKKPKPTPVKSNRNISRHGMPSRSAYAFEETVEEEESEEESTKSNITTVIKQEYIHMVVIQKQERRRQWFMKDFISRCQNRRTYFAKPLFETSEEIKNKAASLIQKMYREFMRLKREKIRDHQRDVLLGLVPDPFRKVIYNFNEENNKIYQRRREIRENIKRQYDIEFEKENTRIIMLHKDDQIDDITEQITVWFKEWYYGYGFFPQFPYPIEGGTILVIRGDYPTIQEKIEEDENNEKKNKGKTKDMLKAEMKMAKLEADATKEKLRQQAKKEAEELFKARCNPDSDPGYKPQSSETTRDIETVLQQYRVAWSLYDEISPDTYAETVYGYLKPLITEDIMCQLHKDCRLYVDELARLDLKLLTKRQEELFKRMDRKFPKQIPRKKPTKKRVPKELVVDKELLKKFEPVFDADLVSKPTTKLSDVYGDFNFAAYEYNIRDPDAKFPPPSYGDVKERLVLSCIFGMGTDGAPRKRSVLFLGPKRNGKSFLADAVAGELNAVKLDVSPEVFTAKVDRPAKVLTQVFAAARVFQPSVIFLKNIERVFAKKVAPEDKMLKAKDIKGPLKKLVKGILQHDKVLFIGTCSTTTGFQLKPLVSLFDDIILIPRTDYGTVRQYFYEKLMSIRSVPRNFPVQALAQLLQGYGFGVLVDAFNNTLNPRRISTMSSEPLKPQEFLSYIMETGAEPMTIAEYEETFIKFYNENSALKKDKEDYAAINSKRAEFYAAMEKKKQKEKDNK